MRDFYEILGISKDATEDEIKRSYRRLAKEYHPDLNPDNSEAEQKFKEASAAYEILSNPDKRSRYDRFGHAGVDPQAQNYNDFSDLGDMFGDIFGDIFGGGFGGFSSGTGRRTGPSRGSDLRYNMNIDFKEAVFGIEKDIQIRRSESCSNCNGSGAKPGTDKITCTNCKGSGEVRYAQQTPFGQMVRVGTCEVCKGAGEIIEEKCDTCNGNGKETKTRTISIKVPAGVDNDSVISLRGEGEGGGNGGPPGDLYIYISVNEDPIFKRQGNNIYLDLPISFTEAALGAEIQVPTLEEIEKFSIPAGTQSGSQFRLRHKGVPNLRGLGKGDLIFRTNIDVPTNLSEKQKQLLLEFSKLGGDEYKENKKGFFSKVKDAFN